MIVANAAHLRGVSIKHAIVMCLHIFGENIVELLRRLIAVSGASLLGHFDTTVGHESTLERLVGLQAHNFLQFLRAFANVRRGIGRERRNHLGFHVEHTVFSALLLLQLLEHAPKLIGSLCWASKKVLCTVIGSVVFLDKVS